jgi:hypothetical protein
MDSSKSASTGEHSSRKGSATDTAGEGLTAPVQFFFAGGLELETEVRLATIAATLINAQSGE